MLKKFGVKLSEDWNLWISEEEMVLENDSLEVEYCFSVEEFIEVLKKNCKKVEKY